jgi:bacillithiol system protein YtxJ
MTTSTEIRTEDEMRAFLEASNGTLSVLFKHSPTCGTSQVAWEEWEEWIHSSPSGVSLAWCDVVGARPAARGIASWLGVLHQSPQVLVLRDGKCVAHASHYSITRDWLRNAVS